MNKTDIQSHSEDLSCVDPHFWRLCLVLKDWLCLALKVCHLFYFASYWKTLQSVLTISRNSR